MLAIRYTKITKIKVAKLGTPKKYLEKKSFTLFINAKFYNVTKIFDIVP
jgi:hypothetical protein